MEEEEEGPSFKLSRYSAIQSNSEDSRFFFFGGSTTLSFGFVVVGVVFFVVVVVMFVVADVGLDDDDDDVPVATLFLSPLLPRASGIGREKAIDFCVFVGDGGDVGIAFDDVDDSDDDDDIGLDLNAGFFC